jgi:hypothetical protein
MSLRAIFIVAVDDAQAERHVPAPIGCDDLRLAGVNPPVIGQLRRLTRFDEFFQLPVHFDGNVRQRQREAYRISARVEDEFKNAIPMPQQAENRSSLPDITRRAEPAEHATLGVSFAHLLTRLTGSRESVEFDFERIIIKGSVNAIIRETCAAIRWSKCPPSDPPVADNSA